jgi:hypothetical protein
MLPSMLSRTARPDAKEPAGPAIAAPVTLSTAGAVDEGGER